MRPRKTSMPPSESVPVWPSLAWLLVLSTVPGPVGVFFLVLGALFVACLGVRLAANAALAPAPGLSRLEFERRWASLEEADRRVSLDLARQR